MLLPIIFKSLQICEIWITKLISITPYNIWSEQLFVHNSDTKLQNFTVQINGLSKKKFIVVLDIYIYTEANQ